MYYEQNIQPYAYTDSTKGSQLHVLSEAANKAVTSRYTRRSVVDSYLVAGTPLPIDLAALGPYKTIWVRVQGAFHIDLSATPAAARLTFEPVDPDDTTGPAGWAAFHGNITAVPDTDDHTFTLRLVAAAGRVKVEAEIYVVDDGDETEAA